MYFYVDESGHTGTNLFDPAQPALFYGVLSGRSNVDVLAEPTLVRLRERLGVDRLHAAELGNRRLAQIGLDVVRVQKKLDLRFDLYLVAKADHAIICFFDQVFDQGVNPAVTWTGYWTPLRYALLLRVAYLFDEGLARKCWEARINLNDARAEEALVEICKKLRSRVSRLPDARSRQLITDALEWAMRHPRDIYYNVKSKNDLLQITPNVIGFQSVMHGIAMRIREHRRQATSIIVDQQSQFNKAQRTLAEFFAKARESRFRNGPGLPEIDFSNMPTIPISFKPGLDSAGLELVDIHLWAFKRVLDKKELAPELWGLVWRQRNRAWMDEISLNALDRRWSKWLNDLPEPTEEQMERAKELLAFDEDRRLRAMSDALPLPNETPELRG